MTVIENRMQCGLYVKMQMLFPHFCSFMPVKGQRVNCFISN